MVRWHRIEGTLDLSFRSVPRLVLVDCDLTDPLRLEACDLAGLEMHRCTAPGLDLNRARVRGDVRLLDLAPKTSESMQHGTGTRGKARLTCPITAEGAVIEGDLDLTGAEMSVNDEEALVAACGASRDTAGARPFTVNWELVLQAVGLASGLAAWVAVVGGARLWARMEAANAPALPTLAGLGQDWMVAEGLQTLLVPILLGIVVSLLVYFSRWERRLAGGGADHERAGGERGSVQSQHGAAAAPVVAEQGDARTQAVREGAVAAPDDQMAATTSPPPSPPRPHIAFDRARPVIALRRLLRNTGPAARWVFGVIFGLLTVTAMSIAQASLKVLLTTALTVAASAAVAAALDKPKRAGARRLSWGFAAAFGVGIFLTWFREGLLLAVVALLVAAILAVGVGVVLHRGGLALGVLLLVVLVIAGLLLSLVVTVEIPWLLFMAAMTALSVWITLGAFVDKSPRAAAVTVFVAIVAWSGALGYAREIGDRTPDLPLARVELREGSPDIGGYLLGRSPSHVFLAQDPAGEGADIEPGNDVERHVVTIAESDIERLVYGTSTILPEVEKPDIEGWWQRLGDLIGGGDASGASGDREGGGPETRGEPPGGPGSEGRSPEPRPPDELTPTPLPEPPFDPEEAIGRDDHFVAGVPVRFALQGLRRNGDVVYLGAWVRNMSDQERNASDLLALAGGDFDTPMLVDIRAERVHEVSLGNGRCDCSRDLDRLLVPPHGSRWLWAIFVVRGDAPTLDVLVPPFDTFRDVPVD